MKWSKTRSRWVFYKACWMLPAMVDDCPFEPEAPRKSQRCTNVDLWTAVHIPQDIGIPKEMKSKRKKGRVSWDRFPTQMFLWKVNFSALRNQVVSRAFLVFQPEPSQTWRAQLRATFGDQLPDQVRLRSNFSLDGNGRWHVLYMAFSCFPCKNNFIFLKIL